MARPTFRCEVGGDDRGTLLPVLTMEARRRAAVITELFQRFPWNGPTRGTALAAGLRSVAADIAAGRLP